MQSRDKFFDDLAKLMQNAVGVAQDARDEAENVFRSFIERKLNEMNLVDREEFEAVREMAIKARTENDRLAAQIRDLEARLADNPAAEPGQSGNNTDATEGSAVD